MFRITFALRGPVTTCALLASLAGAPVALADNESSAVDSGNWVRASRSGWVNDRVDRGATNPAVGAWKENYKHFFNAQAEPAWASVTSHNKPNAAGWTSAAGFYDTGITGTPAGSSAQSWWWCSPYKLNIAGDTWFYSKESTYSKANRSGADTKASCKTRLDDPWVSTRPNIDPTWPSGVPLDADGQWTNCVQTSLFGSFTEGGSIGLSLSMALSSSSQPIMDPTQATEYLRVSIDHNGADVYINPDSRFKVYRAGVQVSSADIVSFLNGYMNGAAFSLEPSSFDVDPESGVDTFDPANPSHLAEILSLETFLQLDDTVNSTTAFTQRWAEASAVPAPASVSLIAGAAALLVRRRR